MQKDDFMHTTKFANENTDDWAEAYPVSLSKTEMLHNKLFETWNYKTNISKIEKHVAVLNFIGLIMDF